MENNYIAFEIAKNLKEIGFDKLVNKYYYTTFDGDIKFDYGDNDFICLNHNKYDDYFSAPLYQEVIEWLFEKHHLILLEMRDLHRNYNGWYFEILKQENEMNKPTVLYSHDFNFDTRREALISGILKSIEIIKE